MVKILEMEERARRVTELSGREIDVMHAKSVLLGIIDMETLKHASPHLPEGEDPAGFLVLKAKVLEFANMLAASTRPEGELKSCEEVPGEGGEEEWHGHGDQGGEDAHDYGEGGAESLNVMRHHAVCYDCGGKGHYGPECPSRKGGGKVAGQKGKSKGKGKVDFGKAASGVSPTPKEQKVQVSPKVIKKVKERDREERASCACWTMAAYSFLMRKRLIDTSRMKKQGMKLEKMFVSSFPVKTQIPVWRNCGHLTKMMISRGSGTKVIGMH